MKNIFSDIDPMLDRHALHEILGIGKTVAVRYLEKGIIPNGFCLNGKWMVSEKDFISFIDSLKTEHRRNLKSYFISKEKKMKNKDLKDNCKDCEYVKHSDILGREYCGLKELYFHFPEALSGCPKENQQGTSGDGTVNSVKYHGECSKCGFKSIHNTARIKDKFVGQCDNCESGFALFESFIPIDPEPQNFFEICDKCDYHIHHNNSDIYFYCKQNPDKTKVFPITLTKPMCIKHILSDTNIPESYREIIENYIKNSEKSLLCLHEIRKILN